MAQAVGELASQGSPAYQGAEGILDKPGRWPILHFI
jgi:hypothetical protein